MKVQLILQKTYEIDLDSPYEKDLKEMILEAAAEMEGDPTDPDCIHDAIRHCLENDVS